MKCFDLELFCRSLYKSHNKQRSMTFFNLSLPQNDSHYYFGSFAFLYSHQELDNVRPLLQVLMITMYIYPHSLDLS